MIRDNGFYMAVDGGVDFLLCVEKEQDVAQQPESGDYAGLFAGGFVFEQASVLAPVIAIFDAAPVAPNELSPLRGRARVGLSGAEVDAFFGFLKGG